MKLPFIKILFAAILLPMLSTPVFAQLGEQVQQKFRCLALDTPVREPLYTQLEGGDPVRIYTSSRTPPIQYSGPNPVVFYRETTNALGQKLRVPVGQFTFNGEFEAPLLLFTNPDNDGTFRITAIEDSLENTPVGSYRIFNFTRKDIAGMIGEARFHTNAGGEAILQLEQAGRLPVTVKLAEFAEAGPQRLYSATWDFTPGFRYLVFIIPTNDRTRGNISIRVVTDFIQTNTAMN